MRSSKGKRQKEKGKSQNWLRALFPFSFFLG
jgi:hypothetical protein